MATYASRPAWEVKARAVSRTRVAVPAGLGLLVVLSLLLRTTELGIGFWIDEGLSTGIADRPLTDIPGILRQDGSPPLYYMLLHVWMGVFGDSESAIRALSTTCALLAVPVAWWAGRALFSTRAGWIAAALAATNPFLTQYAQEGRMYALVALLGLFASATFGRTFLIEGSGRRRWAVGYAVSLALLMYTHNWSLFFATACGVTWLVLLVRARGDSRRELLRLGLIAFGGALLLYLPWIPTTLYQAAHTGAPWATAPELDAMLAVPGQLLGTMAEPVYALAGGVGVAALLARGERGTARTILVTLAIGAGTVLLAWLASQAAPAWANRYLAVGLCPFLLAAAGGLAYAGRVGLAALLLVCIMGITDTAPKEKSNVRTVVQDITPSLRPGDLVVSTQPEQISVLHYYLPPGLRYATVTGLVPDVGVTDWRDGTDRLEAADPERDLRPLLDDLPVGHRLVLVVPEFRSLALWRAPWTTAIRLRSAEWEQYISNDTRFRAVTMEPATEEGTGGRHPVTATVYVKTRS